MMLELAVGALILTNYGMKVPLSSSVLFQKSSLLEAWFPSSTHYPPNTFDIAFTVHSDTLYTVRLLPDLRLTRYILFSPLDFRPRPVFNHGGSFKLTYHTSHPPNQTSAILSLSCYSPLYYFLIQSTPSSHTLRSLSQYRMVKSGLTPSKNLYPSPRPASYSPWWTETRNQQRPYDILPHHRDIFSLAVADYLIAVPQHS